MDPSWQSQPAPSTINNEPTEKLKDQSQSLPKPEEAKPQSAPEPLVDFGEQKKSDDVVNIESKMYPEKKADITQKKHDEKSDKNVASDLEPKKPSSKLKLILIISGSIIVILLAVYFIFFYKAWVNITVEPNSAQIQIGETTSAGSTQLRLKPGTYTLIISLTDYIPLEKEVTINPSRKYDINVSLNHQPEPVKMVDYPAQFVAQSQDQTSLLYLSNQGQVIYKIDDILSESKQAPYAITPNAFNGVENIIWHPNKDLALISQGGIYSLYDFSRYNLLTQESTVWPEGIISPVWRPDGEKVIYYNNPPSGEKVLIKANKNNSEKENIYNLKDVNLDNPKLHWSKDSQKVLIVDKQIFVFDVYNKTLKQLAQFENVTAANITPDSSNIIYEKGNKLYLIDLNGENQKDLQTATSLNKTVWFDDNNLICFINSESGDNIYKLNVNTGEKIEYSHNPKHNINATNIIISQNKKKVFYNQDDNLYFINLVNKLYQ